MYTVEGRFIRSGSRGVVRLTVTNTEGWGYSYKNIDRPIFYFNYENNNPTNCCLCVCKAVSLVFRIPQSPCCMFFVFVFKRGSRRLMRFGEGANFELFLLLAVTVMRASVTRDTRLSRIFLGVLPVQCCHCRVLVCVVLSRCVCSECSRLLLRARSSLSRFERQNSLYHTIQV